MDSEEQMLAARLIPPVRSFRLDSPNLFRIENGCRFIFRIPETDEARNAVKSLLSLFWHIVPEISFESPSEKMMDEAYGITVSESAVTVSASGISGAMNALKTLRQLAESERGVLKSSCFILPAVSIEDFPETHNRFIHFCWFPETPEFEIEKEIRLAAYYKFRYAVIESWGMLKFESHPEFCWSEFALPPERFSRLVKLGRSLGITLIPQINTFGHGTMSRSCSGKHALLDFHPEFASLFEPDGWTFCLSNPETRRMLTDMLLEADEIYGHPEFFHIGCDEAYNAGSCALCRRSDYTGVLLDHLKYIHDLLGRRGARTMMWHDMLLAGADPRWKNYIASGHSAQNADRLCQGLPRDMVICDWQYGYPEENGRAPSWPTMRFFKNSGFDVLACPWMKAEGIRSLGKFVSEAKLFGFLETTWHQNFGSERMYSNMYNSAVAAWNPFAAAPPVQCVTGEFFNRHVRDAVHDMKLSKYSETGSVAFQMPPNESV